MVHAAGKAVKNSFVPESQQYQIPADVIGSQVSFTNWLHFVFFLHYFVPENTALFYGENQLCPCLIHHQEQYPELGQNFFPSSMAHSQM